MVPGPFLSGMYPGIRLIWVECRSGSHNGGPDTARLFRDETRTRFASGFCVNTTPGILIRPLARIRLQAHASYRPSRHEVVPQTTPASPSASPSSTIHGPLLPPTSHPRVGPEALSVSGMAWPGIIDPRPVATPTTRAFLPEPSRYVR